MRFSLHLHTHMVFEKDGFNKKKMSRVTKFDKNFSKFCNVIIFRMNLCLIFCSIRKNTFQKSGN